MNVNANRMVVKRFIKDVFEKNRPNLLDELCLEDFVMYFRGEPMITGLVKMKEFVAWHNSTFPDNTWEIKDLVAENDMVAVRMIQRGTHQGEWFGAQATGKNYETGEDLFFRFQGAKAAEAWLLFDMDQKKEQFGFRSLPPDS